MIMGKTISAEEFQNAAEFRVIEAQKSIKEDLLEGIAGRESSDDLLLN